MTPYLTVRNKELSNLKSSLVRGNTRSVLVTGEKGIGKSHLLSCFGNTFAMSSEWNIWSEIDGAIINTPGDFCSELVRNLVSIGVVPPDCLHLLAREFGNQSVLLERESLRSESPLDFGQKLAIGLVEILERRLGTIYPLGRYVPALCLKNVDHFESELAEWFVGAFNQAIRKSVLFKKTRFLFSAEEYSPKTKNMFDRFGLEYVRRLNLGSLTAQQCAELNRQTYDKKLSSEVLLENSQGNPMKLLNFLQKYSMDNEREVILEKQKANSLSSDLSGFSEKELERLTHAAYPDRVNRYNLEFFCSPSDAAFSYNWLKRCPKLCSVAEDGDLILNSSLRKAVFEHCEFENSDLHEKNKIKSTILSAFLKVFPSPDDHWIPINLQVFDAFNIPLVKTIFDPFQAESIIEFLGNHEDQFIETNNQYCLTEDAKLVTNRFIEIGGFQPIDGIIESARKQWDIDLELNKKKKFKLEQEQANISEEVAGIEKQIMHFNDLKSQILNAINKPQAKNKTTKEFSFSISKVLVVVGLVTIALSLVSSLFGSYHAAIGIIITLFGFFWPSVQYKRPNFAEQGLNPKLALETQQHSVEHRINGLSSRVSTLNSALSSISKTLDEGEDNSLIPYVSSGENALE